ncbi:HtaA domain-containing protein [Actinobaculum sp. 313]|uniref:HtaA domain-containing protein n=1 Tax=Actinobaculum sp. 313 TaxID=2495645 RepID=UPI000D5278D1|nr:HtaA domain-containing protein [Actinobaculum sp. 313]AWE42820.1 hypothetical protein DDD63_08780 [Actinobaculum sp. 313]
MFVKTRRKLVAVLAASVLACGGISAAASAALAAPEPVVVRAQSVPVTGSMDWGLKSSWRDYLARPFVGGQTSASGGASVNADGTYHFPVASGQSFDPDNAGTLALSGAIHSTGHEGVLDITFSNPVISYIPNGTSTLQMTVSSKDQATGEMQNYGQVNFATLSGSSVVTNGLTSTINFSTVTLTDAGAAGFGGFYSAGTSLDPITVTVTGSAVPTEEPTTAEPSGEPTVEPSTEPSEEPTVTPTTNPSEEPTTAPTTAEPTTNPGTTSPSSSPSASTSTPKNTGGTGTTPTTNSPQSATSGSAARQCTVDPTKKRVTSGTLSWALRSSFTTYIRGSIAKGNWTTASGANWGGSQFNFTARGGLFDTSSNSGTVYYSGAVHFTGHNGLLDMMIANPELQINGQTGTLYLNVSSSDTSGNKTDYGKVAFANVRFSSVNVSGTSLSFLTSSVTLTESGAKAFAGFYSAGEALDTFSGSAALTNATACDPHTGELVTYDAFGNEVSRSASGESAFSLARTGADVTTAVALALVSLALGAAVLVARRRALI